ncbi:MAG TPA: 2-hydroxyacyl-CoA dehydratase family protein [Acidimicrobiales bacterium]|nr:2-hydroxyacyl-CoA dehydratase family protein [Acidimicrobiales bacterium]
MAEATAARRRNVLAVNDTVLAHQRRWFAELRRRVADGEPYALLSADAPHEIYRAMGIPYVVVQWWSSLIAAKQQAPAALAALGAAGLPDDVEPYNSLGLGMQLLGDTVEQPWGGLPPPAVIQCALSGDGARKLYERWAAEIGATFFPLERSVEVRLEVPARWWEELPHHWDEVLDEARLDVFAAQLEGLAAALGRLTGRRLSSDDLEAVLELANAQAECNRSTRDLIARSVPAPVGAADTMTATMVPQWHRGSREGLALARAFHDEVAGRVAAGEAACAGERVRMMWLGRGLWSSLGLYQRFEHDRQAVFVWSMYLGLAADGYLRYVDGRDPLRALAARFVPMGDELRMPAWSAPWHLEEARRHGIDGVVSLGEDDWFSTELLAGEGIPVLSIDADNVDRRTWNEDELFERIGRFVDEQALPAAARRRG